MPRYITAGVDEVGRGCLAGPVVAAAVILPWEFELPGLTDSKLIPAERRAELAVVIRSQARAWAIGVIWPRLIEELNILGATKLAMRRAVEALRLTPSLVLIDGNQPIPIAIRQRTVVDGDLHEPCISAASILAKVFRDKLMVKLDRRYPGYGLAKHKGYGTVEHREALERMGPCVLHRRTFSGVVPPGEEHLWLPGL